MVSSWLVASVSTSPSPLSCLLPSPPFDTNIPPCNTSPGGVLCAWCHPVHSQLRRGKRLPGRRPCLSLLLQLLRPPLLLVPPPSPPSPSTLHPLPSITSQRHKAHQKVIMMVRISPQLSSPQIHQTHPNIDYSQLALITMLFTLFFFIRTGMVILWLVVDMGSHVWFDPVYYFVFEVSLFCFSSCLILILIILMIMIIIIISIRLCQSPCCFMSSTEPPPRPPRPKRSPTGFPKTHH